MISAFIKTERCKVCGGYKMKEITYRNSEDSRIEYYDYKEKDLEKVRSIFCDNCGIMYNINS